MPNQTGFQDQQCVRAIINAGEVGWGKMEARASARYSARLFMSCRREQINNT